jgi:transcriptional regulator with XRE-family HTH domain
MDGGGLDRVAKDPRQGHYRSVPRTTQGAWPSERELGHGLSHRLRTAREKQGLSQAEVARRLGLSKSSITKYEAGTHMPGVRVLVRLAAGLGVSIDHLVGLAAAAPALAGDPELAEPLRELGGMDVAFRVGIAQVLGGLVKLGRLASEYRKVGRA